MIDAVVAMLQRHPFVEDFDAPHVDTLATMASRVRFNQGQVLFREGDESMSLISSGRGAEIVAPEHTFRVQTVGAGDELGWSALLMGRGKHFQARVLER